MNKSDILETGPRNLLISVLMSGGIRNLLLRLIDERQLKQREIAEILEISQSQVSYLLSGRSQFSEGHIDALLKYFGFGEDLNQSWDAHHESMARLAAILESGGKKAEIARTLLEALQKMNE